MANEPGWLDKFVDNLPDQRWFQFLAAHVVVPIWAWRHPTPPLPAGLSHMSKELIEELLAPRRRASSCGRGIAGRGERARCRGPSSQDGEILRPGVFPGSRVVFVENDVELPVRIVFHAPMGAHDFQPRLAGKRLEKAA
jgi:hypothetical protein